MISEIYGVNGAQKPTDFQSGDFYLFEDLSNYKKVTLVSGQQKINLSHEDLECQFNYKIKDDSDMA